MDMKVGSPPMVSRTSASVRRWSTCFPAAWIVDHWSGVYGRVTRGSSCTRRTTLEYSSVDTQGLVDPLIAAAVLGCGVADSGMCPSPANSPDVGSIPIQPAPGIYTSAQACRSVKSAAGPDGPSSDLTSEASWTRYPETNRAARPSSRSSETSSQAESRHEPIAVCNVWSGACPPGSILTE